VKFNKKNNSCNCNFSTSVESQQLLMNTSHTNVVESPSPDEFSTALNFNRHKKISFKIGAAYINSKEDVTLYPYQSTNTTASYLRLLIQTNFYYRKLVGIIRLQAN
jgi:hypothetical protein